MADTIYTVGLQVESAQLVHGANQARTALTQLGAAEAQAARQGQQLATTGKQSADAMRQQSTAAKAAAQALGQMRQQLVGMAATAIGIRTLTSALTKAVDVAMQFESLTAVLNMTNQQAGGAQTAFAFVRAEAERLGSNLLALTDAYTRLTTATQGTTFAGKATEEMLQGLNAAARAYRISQKDMQDATRPLVQMFMAGTIQMDELRDELGTKIPGAIRDMVQATNGAVKNEQELFEAMEKTRFGAEATRNVIYNLTQIWRREYTPAALAAAQATDAAFNRLQTSWLELQKTIGDALLPALGEVARAFTELTDAANANAKELGSGLGETVRLLGAGVIGVAGTFVTFGKVLGAVAAGAVGDFQAMKIGLDDANAAGERFAATMNKLISGEFAPPPTAPGAKPAVTLRQVTLQPGTEDKEKESPAEKARKTLQRDQEAFEERLQAAREKALYSELELVAVEAQRLKYSAEMVQYWTEFAALTDEIAANKAGLEEYDTLAKQYHQDIQAIYMAMETGISLQEAEERLAIEQLHISDEYKASLASINAERRAGLQILADEEAAREKAAQDEQQRLERQAQTLQHLQQGFYQQLLPAQDFDKWLIAASDMDEAEKALAMSIIDSTYALEAQQDAAKKSAEALQEVGDTLVTSVLSAIEEVTQTGEFNFARFADSVIRDLLRVLQTEYLKPAMEGWVQAGLKLATTALGAFGGGAGAGAAAGATTALAGLGGSADLGLGADFGAIFTQAVGGPLRRGVTLVGEAGPEAIVSRGGRSMVFPSSHPISRMAVRAHLPGRQFGGPLPSAVMGGSGSEVMSQPSASGPGQVAPVIVNVYAQDAQSFLKSKGEVQRQMMNAWRSAQRS